MFLEATAVGELGVVVAARLHSHYNEDLEEPDEMSFLFYMSMLPVWQYSYTSTVNTLFANEILWKPGAPQNTNVLLIIRELNVVWGTSTLWLYVHHTVEYKTCFRTASITMLLTHIKLYSTLEALLIKTWGREGKKVREFQISFGKSS